MNHRPGFTGWLARSAARHPIKVIVLWAALVAVAYFAASTMNLTANPSTAGTESTLAKDLIEQRLRAQTQPEEYIVVESTTATADQPAYAAYVDGLVGDLRALRQVDSVRSYRDGSQGLVSADGHTALIPVVLTGDKADASDSAEPVVDVVDRASGTGGFRATTVGLGSVEGEMNTLLGETLQQGEMIGIIVALVILLIVFGAAVAAGLPIVLSLLSIFVAAGATALASNVM
jgi:RND superfamily putative drug exporter